MRVERANLSDMGVALAVGLAIPLAVSIGLRGYWGLALATGLVMALGLGAVAVGWEIRGRVVRPELELLDETAKPARAVVVEVAGARGVCPLGFKQGSAWAVSAEGRLSRPLCRPAVSAVSPLVQRTGNGHAVACNCPLKSQDVWFTVRAAA